MKRIFVSSTFNDMHRERDFLENIQQDLNSYLSDLGEQIEFVDLRWGICTEALDEDSQNKAVLEGCFSAIDKADYLLIFLGHRYGSSKSYDEVVEYLGKKKTDAIFNKPNKTKSITELEIAYAQTIRKFNSENIIVCVREEETIEAEAEYLIKSFTEHQDYSDSIIRYKDVQSSTLKSDLKNHLIRIIEKDKSGTRFDRDKRRLKNMSLDAVLNTKTTSYKTDKNLTVFAGTSGIGKTVTASRVIQNSITDDTLVFVTWETSKESITYKYLLKIMSDAFREWFKDETEPKNYVIYLKKCMKRLKDQGREFLLFLDAANKISNIKYTELLSILSGQRLVISTDDSSKILSSIPGAVEKNVFKEDDICFDPDEIADIIKNTFTDHGKAVRDETVAILCKKSDITKPLYLHHAIKRLLFLKKSDFERCGPGESPEVKVLSALAEELPDKLNDLLIYSIKNVYNNSDIDEEIMAAIRLLSDSYGWITDDIIVDFLVYKGVAEDRKKLLSYVYEIKNRLQDFILTDNEGIRRKYNKDVYNWIVPNNDVVSFVEANKHNYKNEYFIQEYMYWNRDDGKKLDSFLSTKALWKFENKNLRKLYRKCFWNLMEDGYIKFYTIYNDSSLLLAQWNVYPADDDEMKIYSFYERWSPFNLLSENLENEYHRYEKGDGVLFLFGMAFTYLYKIRHIFNKGIFTCQNDIPMYAITSIEHLCFLYRELYTNLVDTDNKDIVRFINSYIVLAEQTINSPCINILKASLNDWLTDNADNRSISYCHSIIRLQFSCVTLLNLGEIDKRCRLNGAEGIEEFQIYFNWNHKDDKIFDTVKQTLLCLFLKIFEKNNPKTAMYIKAVEYYLDYADRKECIDEYEDAVILSVLFIYEVLHLSYFRSYSDSVESYRIKNYPYTVSDVFNLKVDYEDISLRGCISDTISELRKAFETAYVSDTVSLTEKCILDYLKGCFGYFIYYADISDKYKRLLGRELDKFPADFEYVDRIVDNEDLFDFWPGEFIKFKEENGGLDYEFIIRKVVRSLYEKLW
jgi:hypothetical protein